MSVEARLQRIHCADAPDLATYAPDDPARFSLFVQLLVGPAGTSDAESFEVEILTPSWLEQELVRRRDAGASPIASGRGRVFVLRYEPHVIEPMLRSMVASCTGDTWAEVARKLARIGHWEFEDYRETEVDADGRAR